MTWRDIADLIDNAEAEIGVSNIRQGKRLQGGGIPNNPDPYRGKKMQGGSSYVNPYPGDNPRYRPGYETPHDYDNVLKSLYNECA